MKKLLFYLLLTIGYSLLTVPSHGACPAGYATYNGYTFEIQTCASNDVATSGMSVASTCGAGYVKINENPATPCDHGKGTCACVVP